MISPTISDLGLLIPELILVVMALALILAARRIRRSNVAVVGTVLAALAAGATDRIVVVDARGSVDEVQQRLRQVLAAHLQLPMSPS